jgi:hypothetical protein
VSYENDDSSSETYLYERESKTLSLLFQHHPQLNELLHVHLHFVPPKLEEVVWRRICIDLPVASF